MFRAADRYRARGERIEAGDGVDERRLAGAIRPDEAGDLAAPDGEAHIVHRREAGEGLDRVLDTQGLRSCGGFAVRRLRQAWPAEPTLREFGVADDPGRPQPQHQQHGKADADDRHAEDLGNMNWPQGKATFEFLQHFLQNHHEPDAHHGAGHGSHAAEDQHRDIDEGHVKIEVLRGECAQHMAVERACHGGKAAGDHPCHVAHALRADAQCQSCRFVVTHRLHHQAVAAVLVEPWRPG